MLADENLFYQVREFTSVFPLVIQATFPVWLMVLSILLHQHWVHRGVWRATVPRAAKSWTWLKQLKHNTIKDDWCSFKRRDMRTHRKTTEGETGAMQLEVKNIKSSQ